MEVDPSASMRIWAIEIELGGRVFDVPPLPAADWFPILTSGDPSRILDLVVSDPADESNVDEYLLSGKVDPEELGTSLRDAIEEVTGRSFHAASVLAIVAESQWPAINGRLAQRGFRWDVMPIGAALDAIYAIVIEGMANEEGRTKFLQLLDNEALTSGRKGRKRQSAAVVDQFESMAGPKPTGGLRASAEPSGGSPPRTPPRPRQPRQGARSTEPSSPPGPPDGSDPPASSGRRPAAVGPASGTEPRPPRPARSRPRSQSGASEAELAPPM